MITIRPAGWRDAWRLYRWRTEPAAAAAMFLPPPASFVAHLRWLWRSLRQPRRRLFIVLLDGRPVGQARYDLERGYLRPPHDRAFVGILISRAYWGLGCGMSAIALTTATAFQQPSVREAWARIRRENAASQRSFAAAGFIPYGETDTEVRMVRHR